MTVQLTEAEVQNCSWTLSEVTPEYRRYIGHGTHPVTGAPITVQKTEYLAEAALVKRNAEARNEADGQRWTQGSGSDRNGVPLVHVGSVPLNKFYSEIAPYLREGDKDMPKWWLERSENEVFRTKRGKL
jgi:hypothetical protein